MPELLLIREPERRFYFGCRNAGLRVSVADESIGVEQVFDLGNLRLLFTITRADESRIKVRFDPASATFTGPRWEFSWTELMFRTGACMEKVSAP